MPQWKCSVHGKKRTEDNLVDDGKGGWCCSESSPCKGGGDGGVGGGANQTMCSIHGKMRSEAFLLEDGAGGWCCSDTSPCKGGSGKQTTCSLHGKMRSDAFLIEDGAGGWCCSDTSPCRIGGAARGGVTRGGRSANQITCSIHGKMRSEAFLVEDGAGGWCCSDASPCKGGGGVSREGCGQTICSVHGKMRSEAFLTEDGEGGWCCSDASPCKESVSTLLCSIHGKMRSEAVLVDDGEGGWCCSPSSRCKVLGATAVTPNDAVKVLAETYSVFESAWATYCQALGQEGDDPSECDEPYIAKFVQYAAQLIESDLSKAQEADIGGAAVSIPSTEAQATKRQVDGPAAKAPIEKKRLVIKKSVADEIRRLNESGALQSPIRLGAVAGTLSQLGEAAALEALTTLKLQVDDVEDPNQFLSSYSLG